VVNPLESVMVEKNLVEQPVLNGDKNVSFVLRM
jgi:hypothetical protein